jgi:hypothetical protein
MWSTFASGAADDDDDDDDDVESRHSVIVLNAGLGGLGGRNGLKKRFGKMLKAPRSARAPIELDTGAGQWNDLSLE